MGKYLEKYDEILAKYRTGVWGDMLNLNEILSKAGEPDLMEKMSKEEMEELRDRSQGFYKVALNNEIKKRWGK